MRRILVLVVLVGCMDAGEQGSARRGLIVGTACRDFDGDGFVAGCPEANDCNDGDKTVSPAVVETCNGRDDDCDGVVDELATCKARRVAPPGGVVRVPAGGFVMGSDPGEGHRDERPEHVVRLDAFSIDVREVTNADYRACVGAGACKPPSRDDSTLRQGYFTLPEFDAYPIIFVSWSQARDYCAWKGGRLPTEAEWEKAARGPAPDERNYPWGDTEPDCSRANFGGPEGCVGDTDEVGRRQAGASPFGLLDMAGNVWEWTADWYDSQSYAASPTENPKGPEHGSHRVIRGGCWLSDPSSLRVSCRQAELPSTQAPNIGVRCAY